MIYQASKPEMSLKAVGRLAGNVCDAFKVVPKTCSLYVM